MLQVRTLSPNPIEDQKKKGLCPLNRAKTKKKVFTERKPKKGLYSAGIWDLFVLTATFSFNHPDAYSQWRER